MEALLGQPMGVKTLSEALLGSPLTETAQRVTKGEWGVRQGYTFILRSLASALGLDFSVFEKAALLQPDALWPNRGAVVTYVRGHCDLRGQSLSRQRRTQVIPVVADAIAPLPSH